MNSAKARQRADELQGRLKQRLEALNAEQQLSSLPPVVAGRRADRTGRAAVLAAGARPQGHRRAGT